MDSPTEHRHFNTYSISREGLLGVDILGKNEESCHLHVATLRKVLALSTGGLLPSTWVTFVSVLSVVQEVIEFFVMVFQFGVPQALFGVRRMLPLIWSKEPGVREAVLNAYRQLYLNPKGDSTRYM